MSLQHNSALSMRTICFPKLVSELVLQTGLTCPRSWTEEVSDLGRAQPRSQALPSCLRKDPGWGWSRVSRKFDRPRGSRQSIKLHASTFELYTSIARSECFVPINFENHIYFKILAKFDLCLLLNYNNMLNRFL